MIETLNLKFKGVLCTQLNNDEHSSFCWVGADFTPYQEIRLRSASTIWKLTGICVLNTNGTILKKMNDSFSVQLCLGKYLFSLFTF